MVSVRFARCEGVVVVLASVKSAELVESVRLAAEKGTVHPWSLPLDADATMPLYGAYGSPPAGYRGVLHVQMGDEASFGVEQAALGPQVPDTQALLLEAPQVSAEIPPENCGAQLGASKESARSGSMSLPIMSGSHVVDAMCRTAAVSWAPDCA